MLLRLGLMSHHFEEAIAHQALQSGRAFLGAVFSDAFVSALPEFFVLWGSAPQATAKPRRFSAIVTPLGLPDEPAHFFFFIWCKRNKHSKSGEGKLHSKIRFIPNINL